MGKTINYRGLSQSGSGPQLILEITWPDNAKEIVSLGEGITCIGRGEKDNDIPVPDEFHSVSRKHLEIKRDGQTIRLKDLESKNGVFVNQTRIEESIKLHDGDHIQIGSEKLGQQISLYLRLNIDRQDTMTLKIFEDVLAKKSLIVDSRLTTDKPFGNPYLKIHLPDGLIVYYSLEKNLTVLGRSLNADLIFPSSLMFISKRHAEIRQEADGYSITDLQSTNGTRVNNQLLEPNKPIQLMNEYIIRIGDVKFGNSIGLVFFEPSDTGIDVTGYSPSLANPTLVSEVKEYYIGRDIECDIVLASPDVSRNHALFKQLGDSFWIEDLDSSNGTYVNQELVKEKAVTEGDIIQIGSNLLQFRAGELRQYDSHGMRVDVIGLTKDIKIKTGPLRILHNMNFTVLPREFVAIVGGSGAGKSTLMNALIGFRPAEGEVKLNGYNFYKVYDHFRSQLGYVPQSEILHTSLTVDKALDYSARIRLPIDTQADERKIRITEVLETVSMNNDVIRNTLVRNLSGGQRKRVSIAAELLANPKLIFLDEATSGLDPGLEKKMMFTLRQMADEGRTIILITHATTNIVQADHVAFISQGRMVFFGPSHGAFEFFEVNDFADIYERIEKHGEKWENIFQHEKPQNHQKYIIDRQDDVKFIPRRELPPIRFGVREFLHQFRILTQRAFDVLRSDIFTMILMLMLFPLTATLQLIISTPAILTGDLSILADPVAAARTMSESYLPFADLNTFLFVMGLEAVLVGMYVPSNELIKERTVYLRERMINLRVFPYLFSKVAVFTMFAAIQTVLYLLVLSIGIDIPEQGLYFSAPIELFITLFLTMTASMGLGFVVSAISKSNDMATYVLVILLFFQFFFAGTVFDLRDNVAEPLSYLTSTRWALTAIGVTIDMQKQVEATIICNDLPDSQQTSPDESDRFVCVNFADAAGDLMLSYEDNKLVESWLILIFSTIVTLAFTGFMIKRLDRL